MNRSTLAALVVALMLGSGVAGYLIGRPADRVDTPPRTATVTQPTPAAPAPAGRLPRRPRAWRHRPRRQRLLRPRRRPFPCRSLPRRRTSRSPIAASRSTPAAPKARPALPSTSRWRRPTSTTPTMSRITPEVKSALRVVDDKLCIGGLAYGENYQVTPAHGLPGPRRRQARRGAKAVERGAGRPSRRRHPARQGLHPAARQRRRPADHHHQRRQGRPRRLSRERARLDRLRPRPLRRHLPRQPSR